MYGVLSPYGDVGQPNPGFVVTEPRVQGHTDGLTFTEPSHYTTHAGHNTIMAVK